MTAPRRRWAFSFDRNIIGMAAVNPGAFSVSCDAGDAASCTGEITLQYCEVFNQSGYTKDRTPGIPWPQWTELCQPLAGLSVVADTFIVGPASAAVALRPSFTWHGFQHVIVSVSDSVAFEPKLGSLTAEWTAMDVRQSWIYIYFIYLFILGLVISHGVVFPPCGPTRHTIMRRVT